MLQCSWSAAGYGESSACRQTTATLWRTGPEPPWGRRRRWVGQQDMCQVQAFGSPSNALNMCIAASALLQPLHVQRSASGGTEEGVMQACSRRCMLSHRT